MIDALSLFLAAARHRLAQGFQNIGRRRCGSKGNLQKARGHELRRRRRREMQAASRARNRVNWY